MPDTTSTMTPDQAHFRLDDLPYELQYEVVRYVGEDSWGLGSLLNMACVNSHYYEIAVKLIDCYEVDDVRDSCNRRFRNFIDTMTWDDGARAVYMKRLHLTINWHQRVQDIYGTGLTSELDRANRLGAWITGYMIGLRELLVAYKPGMSFLNTDLPPKLQTLIIRPAGLAGFQLRRQEGREPVELAGTVDVHFLPEVLQSKSLKNFDLGGQVVVGEYSLLYEDTPVNESPIEHLVLTVGNFSDQALLKLLQAARGLRSLKFTPPIFEDVNYQSAFRSQLPTSDAANLPAISTFGAGLASQAATLESLTIRRGDSHWCPRLDQIGSLFNFHVLKHLDIDCTMLLGWNHCEHLRTHDRHGAISLSSLEALLPASIETLTLKFEEYHNSRQSGTRYILDIVKRLKTASLTRLSNLRTVTLNTKDTLPYCRVCDEVSRILADGVPQGWRSILSIQEARSMRDVAKDAPFDLTLLYHGHFWDEDNETGVYDEDVLEQRPWLSSWSDVAEADWDVAERDEDERDDSEQDDNGPDDAVETGSDQDGSEQYLPLSLLWRE